MSQFAQLFEAVKNESKEELQRKPKKAKDAKRSPAKKPNDVEAVQTEKIENEASSLSLDGERFAQKDAGPPLAMNPPMPDKTKQIAKSRNADYTQVLTYIRRNTHKEIKKVLIDDPQNRDLSDLVEELLSGWLDRTYND